MNSKPRPRSVGAKEGLGSGLRPRAGARAWAAKKLPTSEHWLGGKLPRRGEHRLGVKLPKNNIGLVGNCQRANLDRMANYRRTTQSLRKPARLSRGHPTDVLPLSCQLRNRVPPLKFRYHNASSNVSTQARYQKAAMNPHTTHHLDDRAQARII